MSKKRTHHFQGVSQYAQQLMDLAEGQPAFSGRGQKPHNKEVVKEITSIMACKKGSFFDKSRPCSCGWHKKAAARKEAAKKEATRKEAARKEAARKETGMMKEARKMAGVCSTAAGAAGTFSD